MRIGIDCRAVRNFEDGIGKYTRRLVENLAALDQEDQFVLFYRDDYDGPRTYPANFTIVNLPYPHLSLQSLYRMGSIVNKYTLDLYHAPFFILPYGLRCKSAITVPDLMALRVPGFFSERSKIGETMAYWYHRLFVPSSIRRADCVMAISKATADDIKATVPGTTAIVVHLGVDDQFKPADGQTVTTAKAKHSLTQRYFLYTGNTKPYKNITGLLQGYSRYVQNGGQVLLRLVSYRDRFRESLMRQIRTLNLDGKVAILENIPNDELPALMTGASAFIFPSINEGFGLPVLEAMACGCPVIASDIPALAEIAGGAALLVPPMEPEALAVAMASLDTDARLSAELGQKGVQNAAKFTWKQYAVKTLNCYRSTVA